jgi:hypothetical protein
MKTALLVWLGLTAVGAAVVALPDRGPRVVSFSRAHGPGVVDAVGIAVMLTGWVVFLVALWRRRQRIALRANTPRGLAVAFVLGLGAGLVVASVAADVSYWWVIGVACLVGAQLAMGWLAGPWGSGGGRRPGNERDDRRVGRRTAGRSPGGGCASGPTAQ